jgi:hypothetical protein
MNYDHSGKNAFYSVVEFKARNYGLKSIQDLTFCAVG